MPHKYGKSTGEGKKENITKSARLSDFSWFFLIKQLFYSRLLDTIHVSNTPQEIIVKHG